jgi:hypothetical protein
MDDHNKSSEIPSNQPHSFAITGPMLDSLRQTKPWARLLSVLGFITIGFMLISGAVNMMGLFGTAANNPLKPFLLIGNLNIVMGLLYFFPSFFLFRFASSIARLLDGGGTDDMEKALANQKSFWKFTGIMTLIAFCFAILGIAAAIIIPLYAKFANH